MKHILIFSLIIAIIVIAFTITPTLTNPTGFVVAETKENESKELQNFRLYTKAVCENISDFIVCHDELFASCGSFEYKLPKNDVNGSSVFSKDWKDPRND